MQRRRSWLELSAGLAVIGLAAAGAALLALAATANGADCTFDNVSCRSNALLAAGLRCLVSAAGLAALSAGIRALVRARARRR